MTQQESLICAAITAAGASSRMGATKALLAWGATTILAAMVDSLRRAGFPRPAVVIGADGERVLAEVRRLGAEALWNESYEKGRFTSIRVAACWARERAEAAGRRACLLLWPVDCPGVAVETLAALVRAAATSPRADVAPAFGGRAGHPVLLCEETLAEILAAPDDANLRDLVSRAPLRRRLVAVADPAVLDNLNTTADYEAFVRSRSGGAVHA